MINGQCTITVLLHDGRLICGITVAIKGLTSVSETSLSSPNLKLHEKKGTRTALKKTGDRRTNI